MKKLFFAMVVIFEILAWIMGIAGIGSFKVELGWAVFFFAISWNARAGLAQIAKEEMVETLKK